MTPTRAPTEPINATYASTIAGISSTMVGTSAKMNTPSAKGSAIRSQEHSHEHTHADGLQLVRRVQRLAGEEAARQRAEGPGDEVHHGDDEANEGNAHTNERGSYQAVLLLLMLTPYSLGFPRLRER